MFSDTVTVFNHYDDGTGAVWYPHVLSGVYLETDRGQIIKKYGPESADKAILHVPIEGSDHIRETTKMVPYLPPKQWGKQNAADLPESITFGPEDFFWKGAWAGENPVKDAGYAHRRTGGFYAYMNANEDYVYKITNVSGPYTVISHLEIGGV